MAALQLRQPFLLLLPLLLFTSTLDLVRGDGMDEDREKRVAEPNKKTDLFDPPITDTPLFEWRYNQGIASPFWEDVIEVALLLEPIGDTHKKTKCEFCKDFSVVLVLALSSVKVRNKIVDNVTHILCGRLPKTGYYFCENLVKSYVPIYLTKFLQALDSGEFCHLAHACVPPLQTISINVHERFSHGQAERMNPTATNTNVIKVQALAQVEAHIPAKATIRPTAAAAAAADAPSTRAWHRAHKLHWCIAAAAVSVAFVTTIGALLFALRVRRQRRRRAAQLLPHDASSCCSVASQSLYVVPLPSEKRKL